MTPFVNSYFAELNIAANIADCLRLSHRLRRITWNTLLRGNTAAQIGLPTWPWLAIAVTSTKAQICQASIHAPENLPKSSTLGDTNGTAILLSME
jgi:hypothetical protein